MDITVAIDCMGGDHGPHVTVPSAVEYLRSDPEANIILVGIPDAIAAELRAAKEKKNVITQQVKRKKNTKSS